LEIRSTPIPVICAGHIKSYNPSSELYEIFVFKTPNDILMGNIYAAAIYSPGSCKYKINDLVKVSMMFNFGGVDNKFLGPCNVGGTNHILGLYDEKTKLDVKIENQYTQNTQDSMNFINKLNGNGLSIQDNGTTLLVSGAIFTSLKSFGFGINKDSHQSLAQNHIRTVGNNDPYYLAKEHFGLYMGANRDDELGRTSVEDFPIIFRRFVTQSAAFDNWVSTCEGAYSPWFGPNNDYPKVSRTKEVLFTKIINKDTLRLTVEAGESDASFVNVRIDDVLSSEKLIDGGIGASAAKLGNRFSFIISGDGTLDLRAGGAGLDRNVSSGNTHGIHISVDAEGNLTIHSKGKISLSHGDNEETNNSIVLDPAKGVDITANKGFRVNGVEVATKNFIDWFDTNKNNLCLVTAIGGPAPLFDLPGFALKKQLIGSGGGFVTDNNNPPSTGKIEDIINFSST